MQITAEARARYELHRRARHRILADLGAPGKGGGIPPLNQKLTASAEHTGAVLAPTEKHHGRP